MPDGRELEVSANAPTNVGPDETPRITDDEQIAYFREEITSAEEAVGNGRRGWVVNYAADVDILLAEVVRLRAVVADQQTRLERARQACEDRLRHRESDTLAWLLLDTILLAAGSGDGR